MRARVPETLTGSLVATAMRDDAAIVSVTPATPPSDVGPRRGRCWRRRPPGPRVPEVAASARSDARLQLDLDVTLVARALAEASGLAGECGRGRGGRQAGADRAASRCAQRAQPAGGGGARPAPASNGKSYWVQVGAFKSPEAARRLAALLVEPEPTGSGRSAVVTESWAADILLTRVRVGPFADRSEAAAKLREMEARGYKPFIAAERE